jgi:hypothetical protein
MAYKFPDTNQQALQDTHWATSAEGVEFYARRALSEITFPNAWGDQFPLLTIINGIERRQAENNAQIAALASALSVATTNPDITPELIKQTIKDCLANFEVTLTTGRDK